mmetsp:Transcript_15169/g.22203  ORF Transcript_15169/g.22203 Transcript_15169/m.22203 type:complete len:83 (+) Transcript_15169:374-622(+)
MDLKITSQSDSYPRSFVPARRIKRSTDPEPEFILSKIAERPPLLTKLDDVHPGKPLHLTSGGGEDDDPKAGSFCKAFSRCGP